MCVEIDIAPLQSKEFTHPQASPEGQDDKRSFAQRKRSDQSHHLVCVEHCRKRLPFGALTNELNWISLADPVANAVIEKHTQDVSNLCATGPCEAQRPQPEFNFSSADSSQRIPSPTWQNPLSQISFVRNFRRVGLPNYVGFQFALSIVIRQFRNVKWPIF